MKLLSNLASRDLFIKLVIAVVGFVVGVLFIVFSGEGILKDIICYFIGAICIVYGVYLGVTKLIFLKNSILDYLDAFILVAFGISVIVFPSVILELIAVFAGSFLILVGLLYIIRFVIIPRSFKKEVIFLTKFCIYILMIVSGILIIILNEQIIQIFPIMIGVLLIVLAILISTFAIMRFVR